MRTALRRFRQAGLLLCGAACGGVLLAGGETAPPGSDAADLGAALFVHNWARPDSWTRSEQLGTRGDGLGPVFNAESCVACHSLGGVGGAGGNEHNVELLSVAFPPRTPPLRRTRLVQRAQEVHPLLTPTHRTVMLHQFGFGPSDRTYDYDAWRLGVVATVRENQDSAWLQRLSSPTDFPDRVPLRLSQRNTPALWGVGEIERLRRSGADQLRQSIALAQASRNRGVSGRLPRTIEGGGGVVRLAGTRGPSARVCPQRVCQRARAVGQ